MPFVTGLVPAWPETKPKYYAAQQRQEIFLNGCSSLAAVSGIFSLMRCRILDGALAISDVPRIDRADENPSE